MVSIWSIVSEYAPWFIAIIAFVLLLEQINYLKRKRFLPGPTFVVPFLGSAISMVTNTTKFWEHQSALAKSSPLGISANYLVGKFVIYIYSSEMSHKIFSNVRPDGFHLIIHPFGKKLFGEHNIIYKFGQQHKDLRRSIAPNFTQKALSTYTSIQQKIILKHMKSWLEQTCKNPTEPIPLRLLCRDMNLETSQTVFAGPYLSEDARKRFNVDYNFFNMGLMTLPFDLPGFAFREAKLAISRLIDTLAISAEESEKRMVNGEEPICLIDFWTQENLRAKTEAAEKTEEGGNDKSTTFYCHQELGGHLFDFLFAAQDASTSSLLWAITFLESHPDILERVRLEVEKVWKPESNEPITGEQLRELNFTEAVAREVVRIRAPATMVPHSAAVDFQLTDDYVIPKGTIIFPSVFDSSFQGFTEPERFDPDRFMEERQEDRVYKRNFLAFGTGPHMCVGQRYAINHLMLFIAMFVTLVDFKRARTDGCDDLAYVPTIVPKDDCRVLLSQRCKAFPSMI